MRVVYLPPTTKISEWRVCVVGVGGWGVGRLAAKAPLAEKMEEGGGWDGQRPEDGEVGDVKEEEQNKSRKKNMT